jgi:DHA2 family multidrug resistance protein
MQTYVRVREQVDSNLLGLHVISGDASVTERLAAYSSAIVARSDGISGASARAAALLVQAVRNQANVLSYRDGFLIVSFGVIVTLLLTALLRPAPSPAAAITRPPPRVSSDLPAAARRSG